MDVVDWLLTVILPLLFCLSVNLEKLDHICIVLEGKELYMVWSGHRLVNFNIMPLVYSAVILV